MTGAVILCALLVAVGLVGIVVPGLPGSLLIGLGIGIWAVAEGTARGWVVFAVAAGCLLVGAVVKYAVPGRRLKATVPTSTLLAGAVCAVVGFFMVPVVGALVGFPLGVYAAERARVGGDAAWTSTKEALRAIGASILIELAAGLTATVVWVVGLVAT